MESEGTLPAGILFYAKRNNRARFFLPSTENYFGGIKVPNIMIDTGATNILLPIEDDQILELRTKFDTEKYSWLIGTSKGVGLLHSPTLIIKPKVNTPSISVELMKDQSTCVVQQKQLRFHLSCSNAKVLLKRDFVQKRDVEKLNDFVRTVEERNTRGDLDVGKSRTYALLGQSFISNTCGHPPFAFVQYDDIAMILDPIRFKWGDFVNTVEYVQNILRSTDFHQFADLEDYDHEGDEELTDAFLYYDDMGIDD